jgi:outer membrane protein
MKSILSVVGVCFASTFCMHPAYAEYTTLEQAWTQAYQNNPSLEAERAKLRATDEQVSIALSHWRPTIDATANVGKTYQYLPAQEVFGDANFAQGDTGYGMQVTQPIFRGFRTLSETEAAKKQVMAGRAQLEAAEQQLLLDTATAFLDVVRDEYVMGIDRDYVTVLRQKLEETKVRARVGDLTNTDVQQAESRIGRAEVARLQIENTLQTDRDAFLRLVGDEPGSLAKPALVLANPKNLNEALRLAETRNPNVIASQYAIEQTDAQVDLNKGSLLPELDMVGSTSHSYGQSITLPGRFDSSQIELQLKIPLYDSGANYAQVRQLQQTSVQHRMELEDARHKAYESAHNGWQTLLTAEAAVKADRLETDAAAKALEGVKVQSRVGTRNTLDVLNAEQELLDAKTDMARSEHDRNLAVLQIKSAIGALTADALDLPLTPYDPQRHYNSARNKWAGFGGANDDIYAHANEDDSENEVKSRTDITPVVDAMPSPEAQPEVDVERQQQ